jgi:hypothetical protein
MSGSPVQSVIPEPAHIRYTDEQRRALYPKILQLRFGPFEKNARRADWGEIAEAIGIARSTLADWRKLDDFDEAMQQYRDDLRRENQTSVATMGDAAVQHVFHLMQNAGSEWVQLEAAREIIKISKLEQDDQAKLAESARDLIEFQKMVGKRKLDLKALADHGIDPSTIIDVPMKPGGFLPEPIEIQNELVREQMALLAAEDDDEGGDTDL